MNTKPKCLVCGITLTKIRAKHCKSHRIVTKKTRELLSKRSKENPFCYKKGHVPWHNGKVALWSKGENNTNWGKFGPAHPKWTGRTPLNKQVRQCPKYKAWRHSIFQRDEFTCKMCGKKGGYLEVDHYPVMFASIMRRYNIRTYKDAMNCEALWNASGRTLCIKCHPRPGRLPKVDYQGKTIKC